MFFSEAESRIAREHKKLKEEAKRKLEEDKRRKMLQLNWDREIEEANRKRREKMEREAEEQREREYEEFQLTGGVKFENIYSPVLLEDSEDDKIILPQSALKDFLSQDVLSDGRALSFRIGIYNPESAKCYEKYTHCGVKEFTAEDGVVKIPPKIVDSLCIPSDLLSIKLFVKYVRLSKVTFVKLQPKENRFSHVGPIKSALQDNLRRHTALTINDIVTIWHRGKDYKMRVVEVRPEPCGTLIDTDVEVELEISEEYKNQQDTLAQLASTSNPTPARTLREASGASVAQPAESKPPTESTRRSEKPSPSLPPEPSEDEQETIFCKVRDAMGKTIARRFRKSEPLRYLFEFVECEASSSTAGSGQTLQLTTRFPRRVFSTADEEMSSKSFQDAGISSNQEMFLLSYA